jgi:hypothetical protein
MSQEVGECCGSGRVAKGPIRDASHRALGYGLAVPCLIIAFMATWLWASEVWQRPMRAWDWSEPILLGTAVVAFVASGLSLLLTRPGIALVRALGVCLFCVIGFLATSWLSHWGAVNDLVKLSKASLDNVHVLAPGGSTSWTEEIGERWDELKREIAKKTGISGASDEREYSGYKGQALDVLLESSRWRVRKAYIQAILRDEDVVRIATHKWHRIFPAVIGHDVTLAKRRELMDELSTLSRDASTAPDTRDAAIFWAGLIITTDLKEFDGERARVRDLMLTTDHPPRSLTGDVWMRLLDVLMSPDTATANADAAAKLTRDSKLLRRAVREGLRGIDASIPAVVQEIQKLDEARQHRAAAALWLDLHHLVRERDEHEGTRRWLAETMARWLREDVATAAARFDYEHRIRDVEFAIELSPADQREAAALAMRLVKEASAMGSEHVILQRRIPPEIGHALRMTHFLDGEELRSTCESIAKVLRSDMERMEQHHETAANKRAVLHGYRSAIQTMRRQVQDDFERQSTSPGSENSAYPEPDMMDDLSRYVPDGISSEAHAFALFVTRSAGFGWKHPDGYAGPRFSDEAVERFIDFVIASQYRKDVLVNVASGELYQGVQASRLTQVLRFDRYRISDEPEQSARDYLRVALVRFGALPPSELPDNLAEIFHADARIHGAHYNYPDPEFWGKLLTTPDATRAVLEKLNQSNDYNLHGLVRYLLHHPPALEIREAITGCFESRFASGNRWERMTAARVLLRLSHWRDGPARVDFRARVLRFFHEVKPSLSEWAHTMMIPMSPATGYPMAYAILEDQCRSEWVPWEDDALSAHYSWSSQIHHELALLPNDWGLMPADGLFMYLNTHLNVCDACPWTGAACEPRSLDVAVAMRQRRAAPPLPFAATPWQRARELHLRRPNLEFPERAVYRPHFFNRG